MNRKQRYILAISWVLSIAAYAYIAYKLWTYDDWSSFVAHLSHASWKGYLCGVLAVGLMPLNMLIEARRWQYLMGGISIGEAQRQVYYSKIAGQLTPYQLGEYPARGLLMKERAWSEVLSMGAVGSMTMTMTIVIAGAVPLVLWLSEGRWCVEWWTVGLMMAGVIGLTLWMPRLVRRWVKIDYSTLFRSIGQSLLRYFCWCVQLGLVLCLFGLTPSVEWWIQIPVYYLLITVAPSVSVAELGVRGAAALLVFGSAEATLAGVLLWGINSLLPMLIGTFVKKNAK